MFDPIGEPRSIPPRIGVWLPASFNLFGQAWQVWVIHGVLALFLPVLLGGGVALAGFAFGVFAAISRGEWSVESILIMAATGLFTVLGIVAPLLYLGAGMIQTAARQLRGQTVTVHDVFVPLDRVMRLFGAFLIITVLEIVGLVLCVVPALIVAALTLYVPPLIVDRGLSVGAALSTSVRMTRPHLLLNILWAVLISVIYQAGGAIAIGYVATLPISVLMLMGGYWEAVNPPQEEAPPYNPLYR